MYDVKWIEIFVFVSIFVSLVTNSGRQPIMLSKKKNKEIRVFVFNFTLWTVVACDGLNKLSTNYRQNHQKLQTNDKNWKIWLVNYWKLIRCFHFNNRKFTAKDEEEEREKNKLRWHKQHLEMVQSHMTCSTGFQWQKSVCYYQCLCLNDNNIPLHMA